MVELARVEFVKKLVNIAKFPNVRRSKHWSVSDSLHVPHLFSQSSQTDIVGLYRVCSGQNLQSCYLLPQPKARVLALY